MSWLNKVSKRRYLGQPPDLSERPSFDGDPYSRQNPDYPEQPNKKDMTQDSLGLGSERHSPNETSINERSNDSSETNSLTSGFERDFSFYGRLMNEDPGGKKRPATDDRGGPGSLEGPDVFPGHQEYNPLTSDTPNDSTPEQVANDQYLRFQNRPSRKVKINNQTVNVF